MSCSAAPSSSWWPFPSSPCAPWAEDRRGKTDQLLLTSPVSLTGIVLGKYLAMVTVLLVPILLICFCPLIIAMNGSATLTADYAAILAFFCMAACTSP